MSRQAWREKYAREPTPWRGIARLGILEPRLRALPRGARVLEMGAGGGKTLAHLRALGLDAVALDWAREGLDAHGIEGDARAPPFHDSTFDAVLAIHVLEHLTPLEALRVGEEVARVLRDGGWVGIRAFATSDLRAPATGSDEREGLPYRYHVPDDLRRAFLSFQEKEVSVERIPVRHGGPGAAREIVQGVFAKVAAVARAKP